MPTAPRRRTTSLIPIENHVFWLTMARHLREIRIAWEIFMGSSSIRTTSAASIAASDPIAPMAIPISARVSTGASLIPSPTKARFPFPLFSRRSSSTFCTLSAGRSSLRTWSMPSSFATASATSFASPVSMTVLATPTDFRAAMAAFDVSFTTSEIIT